MKKKQYSAPAVTTVAVEVQPLMDQSLTTPPNTISSDGGTITVDPNDTETTVDGGDVMSKENGMWE